MNQSDDEDTLENGKEKLQWHAAEMSTNSCRDWSRSFANLSRSNTQPFQDLFVLICDPEKLVQYGPIPKSTLSTCNNSPAALLKLEARMSTDPLLCQLSVGDRSAIDITWSCAAVILACVWKAVHPNVPPPNSRESWWEIALRRLYMTLWTILLPEVVVMRAAAQWCEARRTSEVYQKQHPQDTIPLIGGAGSSKDTDQPKFKKCVHPVSFPTFNEFSKSVDCVRSFQA